MHALGHSHVTAPTIVPKLHYVYIYTINRSFIFFYFCYLVIGVVLCMDFVFPFALSPLDVHFFLSNKADKINKAAI
jgi:hypothetical protein